MSFGIRAAVGAALLGVMALSGGIAFAKGDSALTQGSEISLPANFVRGTAAGVEGAAPQEIGEVIGLSEVPMLTIAEDAPSMEEIARDAKEGTALVVEDIAPKIIEGKTGQATLAK